jgi:hypothetical protein
VLCKTFAPQPKINTLVVQNGKYSLVEAIMAANTGKQFDSCNSNGIHASAAMADNNYWGHPSGPSGRGPGSGESVGKNKVTFAPFLTEAPSFCDPELSEIK